MSDGKKNTECDWAAEFVYYIDNIAPHLDVFEQAVYVYLLRHTWAQGEDTYKISLYSTPQKIAAASSENRTFGKSTLRKKVSSLEYKRLIEKVAAGRDGTLVKVTCPSQASNYSPPLEETTARSLEEFDFYRSNEGREMILKREQHSCFYCMKPIDASNSVMEHVVSRPNGNNSYRNIVAACWTCNAQKADGTAEDHLRNLYRKSMISSREFEELIEKLEKLRKGDLRPVWQ